MVAVCIDQIPTDAYQGCELCLKPREGETQEEWCNTEWKGNTEDHEKCKYGFGIDGKRMERCKGSCNNCGNYFSILILAAKNRDTYYLGERNFN